MSEFFSPQKKYMNLEEVVSNFDTHRSFSGDVGFLFDIFTSAAGFPPLDSHLNSTFLPSTVLCCGPWGMIRGLFGGTRTVKVAYRERMGSIPSAAPTWHWNSASSSKVTGSMSRVQSPEILQENVQNLSLIIFYREIISLWSFYNSFYVCFERLLIGCIHKKGGCFFSLYAAGQRSSIKQSFFFWKAILAERKKNVAKVIYISFFG